LMRAVIILEIEAIAREQKKLLPPLTDDLSLFDCGLDSLCLAILAMRLEDRTGANLFYDVETALPITIGDLIAFYENDAVATGA
jgi:acyl carrier protein